MQWGFGSNTVGPGQRSHGSMWGPHGGYLDAPGSDLLRGSASSQSASVVLLLNFQGKAQTPKCPASHQGSDSTRGPRSPRHLACTLLAPPSRPHPQPLVTRRQTEGFILTGAWQGPL